MLGYLLGITVVLTVFSPIVFTDVFADSFSVTFDKQLYNLGGSLTVTGKIIDFGMPIIAMSIYDPDGKILSANNLEISSQSAFSKTIHLDSPFYEKTGEYKVKFDYGQVSENHYFTIDGDSSESELIMDTAIPEILLVYTEKNQYHDKDVIEISGLVSSLDSPTVLIGVYDPFEMPAGFYFGMINSDLEFTTSFLVKDGVNFRIDGTYSIKAHYAETEAISFFEYQKISQNIIEETIVDEKETFEPPQEKIDDVSDESVINTTVISSESIDEDIKNSDSFDESSSQENKQTTEPSIIKKIVEEIPTPTINSEIKTITKETTKIIPTSKIKKQTNLSVEDIELGILLNQINLACDSSTFTDTITYYDGMGPALYRLCKFDKSLNFFNDSLVKTPNDMEILSNKGSTLGKLGYFSEAIVYYDQAILINPDFLPAKNNKANALANLRNFDEAISLYEKILKENPNYSTARKNLGIALSLKPAIQTMVDVPSIPEIKNTVYLESLLPETITPKQEKQKSNNFLDEVGLAFSSLGSLFGFLN